MLQTFCRLIRIALVCYYTQCFFIEELFVVKNFQCIPLLFVYILLEY